MSDDAMKSAMATWAAKDLPARLDVVETAKLLGFAEHDIQILMAGRKLTPLGEPAPNAPKWFAAVEIIRLAADREWLNKATKEVAKYWRQKRERKSDTHFSTRNRSPKSSGYVAQKVSPDSSPKPSPEGQLGGSERAMASGAQEVVKVA